MIDSKKCYELLKKIPKGKVTTYQEIAKQLGTKGYRAVGQIIGKNPNAPKVPCHRVVRSNGELSGYAFGIKKKIELLESEGVKIASSKVSDFQNKLFRF